MHDLALAVDLGGTNLRCGIIDSSGNLIAESSQSSGSDEGPEAVVQRIARLIDLVATDQGIADDVPIGLVAPGPLDLRTGTVRYAPNLKGWSDVPLRAMLEDLSGREVMLGNDANAQALGEFYFGAASGVDNLIYVALGTGLGGGVIAEGKLIDGIDGLGGELGHTTVNMDGPRCTCGSQGCVESYCSGWAIARDGQALVNSNRSAAIARIAGDHPVEAPAVSEAASEGDPEAGKILRQAGRALGAGLANFVNIFNPEMIVIGGGLADVGSLLLDPARDAMRQYALPDLVGTLEFRRSALGGKTGIFGAAALVFHQGEK
ncbi:MAG: ROK family protein [Thermomicrobiales bacterium]